jgi:hypothetical protein
VIKDRKKRKQGTLKLLPNYQQNTSGKFNELQVGQTQTQITARPRSRKRENFGKRQGKNGTRTSLQLRVT